MKKVLLFVKTIQFNVYVLTANCKHDCDSKHDWVCGSNNQSYLNPCQLAVADCQAQEESITTKHFGRCQHHNSKIFFL